MARNHDHGRPEIADLLRRLEDALTQLGFWGAVLLPLAYLPFLLIPVDTGNLLAIAGLVVLNVICLVLGNDHAT